MDIQTIIETVSDMSLAQLVGDGALLTIIVSGIIEAVPGKWKPVSAFLKWLGGKLNIQIQEQVAEQKKKLEEQSNRLNQLDEKIDQNEIDRIRWEILDFANSCRFDKHHTKDEFDHIISLHTKYHRILESRGMENGQITLEYAYIEKLYRQCQENNSFL